jgi:predicted nicotinamide N-methyase
MEHLHRSGLQNGLNVLEVGCGWGLAGIYCAKNHSARVTATDKDGDVFPFLALHAEINEVRIHTVQCSFEKLTLSFISRFDLLIGSDICFWNELVTPLRRLIRRALRAGTDRIVIADPGRAPFDELSSSFTERGIGEVLDRRTRRPRVHQGRILDIRNPG